MRGGVPKPLHDFTVTYYGPLKQYYKSLGIESKKSCYIYVLDKNGAVKGQFDGYSTPEQINQLFELIDSLNE
jgi:predicted transcriptional regulator